MTRKNGYVVFYLALFYFSVFPLIFPPILYADDDYSFDLEAFEKKPLEWGRYLELKGEHINLNRDGALYLLNSYKDPREALNRLGTTLQFDGSFQKEKVSANWEGRLRLTALQGGDATEYGEKPNEYKTELRIRYFF